MIQIRYSDSCELDIASSPRGYAEIAAAIADLTSSTKDELMFQAETQFDPTPYEHKIPTLIIRRSHGPILVQVKNLSEVVISGSADALDAMRSSLKFADDSQFPDHRHFEYFEGHPIIDPESIPIVFSVAKER